MPKAATLILLAIIAACSAILAQTVPATIIFRVVDPKGNPLDYKIVSLIPEGHPEVNLADRVQNMVLQGATLGATYKCLVAPVKRGGGFTSVANLTATSFRTVAIVTIEEIAVDSIGPLLTRFIVTPSPATNSELTWVEVRPAFSTENEPLDSAAIDNSGTFTLAGHREGLYLFTFYRGNKILATKTVDFSSFTKQPFLIQLD
jgi:hypothetical protein